MAKTSYMHVRIWAALALAACALARGEEVRLRCPAEVGDRCQETKFDSVFTIDGKSININYLEDDWYDVKCKEGSVLNEAWPRFPHPISFSRVRFNGCAPPKGPYMDALQTLNVIVTEELNVFYVPAPGRFTTESFAGLPAKVEELLLSASGEIMIPEPGVVAHLDNVRKMYLHNIRVDKLPSFLDDLALRYTGYKELPVEARGVGILKITELTEMSIPFSMPKLYRLWYISPLTKLPQAPLLSSLTLQDVSAVNLPKSSLSQYELLRTVNVYRLPRSQLPVGLLRGAAQVTDFKLTESNVSSLPADLFDDCPKLKSIDFSMNKLESLPAELFSKITSLEKLLLVGNSLSVNDLKLVAGITTLKELNLAGMPLGDLCEPDKESVLSPLTQLTTLTLARTELTRTCADWLRASALDLRGNRLRSVPCALVRARAFASLDLRANPLERVACKRADYEGLVGAIGVQKLLTIKLDRPLQCDCDAYWLNQLVAKKLVDLDADPALLDVICTDVNKLSCGN